MAKFLAVGSAAGGTLLHLMGHVGHQMYLRSLGIDPGLFPLATDATIVKGLYVVVHQPTALWSAIQDDALLYLGSGIGIAVYVFVLSLLSRITPNDRVGRFLSEQPTWRRDLIKSCSVTAMGFTGIPAAVLLAAVVLAIPAEIAERYGKTGAERMTKYLETVCSDDKATQRCSELREKGELLAVGYIIESSTTHLAFFDVGERRVRTLERDGIETRTRSELRINAEGDTQ